jgi:hypothetical protein
MAQLAAMQVKTRKAIGRGMNATGRYKRRWLTRSKTVELPDTWCRIILSILFDKKEK